MKINFSSYSSINKRIKIIFTLAIFLAIALSSAYAKKNKTPPLPYAQTDFFTALSEEAESVHISGILQKTKGTFVITEKPLTQSRTTYLITKNGSEPAAFKKLKKLTGTYVNAECRITKSTNPFSHTVVILNVAKIQENNK